MAPPRTLVVPAATRLVVVAPHPDDETIAASGLVQRVIASGGEAQLVFVTSGDGYPAAASALTGDAPPSRADFLALQGRRNAEAIGAARALGLAATDLTFLGYPDGGLDALWSASWSRATPYASPYTGVGPFAGEELVDTLEHILATDRSTLLVVPDPRDAHPDHAATGRFALVAARRLSPPPAVLTYVVHDPLWPPALPERPDLPPPGGARYRGVAWWTLSLDPQEVATKRRALANYGSQLAVNRDLLGRFVRPNEMFATAPPAPPR